MSEIERENEDDVLLDEAEQGLKQVIAGQTVSEEALQQALAESIAPDEDSHAQ